MTPSNAVWVIRHRTRPSVALAMGMTEREAWRQFGARSVTTRKRDHQDGWYAEEMVPAEEARYWQRRVEQLGHALEVLQDQADARG